ncbi:MAG: hypothetical protein HY784_16505, partial [Chloroflexi bacterium]|nr:hypothetical protein [Chloroflexota bacterium]
MARTRPGARIAGIIVGIMPASSSVQAQLAELVSRYEAQIKADPNTSEANVEAAFVAPLFGILGWDTDSPRAWNRQVFIRGAGFADVGLQLDDKPVIFLEAKRFGKISRPEDAPAPAAPWGEDVIPSLPQRQANHIDRTPEERQAMRYARARGVRWAILTNFERLVLFDADREQLVFAFDSPQEYLSPEGRERLRLLAPEQLRSGSLDWYLAQQARVEIDANFLSFLRRWRLKLARAIYEHNRDPDTPPGDPVDLDQLLAAVQRTLDRLIVLRYADDHGVLRQHDILENLLDYYRGRIEYVDEYDLHRFLVRDTYTGFYRVHDTSIFAPGHLCEQVRIPNGTLEELIAALNGISFRKFAGDILGNTYESYLGQKLRWEGETLVPEERR